MQSVWSRIWTRVAVSISYDDNHYTTGTPILPFLPGPLWPGVVAPVRVLSMSQIEQTVCKQMTDVELWLLYSNTWNHLTVCKKELQLV